MSSKNAAEKLRTTRTRLVQKYGFYAPFLSPRRFEADSGISTFAVSAPERRIHYRYNPVFVDGCRVEELMGVLHHEILHVLFGHVFANPKDYPNRQARIIAEEVTVNEWVREPLPGKPITLKDFPYLPPGEDTDTRYQRLAERNDLPAMVQSLDGHDLWRTDQTGEGANETDLMALLLAAPDPRLMCKRWLVGLTGNDRAACEDLGQTNAPEKPLDWKRLLERYGGQSPRLVPSFSRPPRRFPRLVGVVPGHKHVRTRPKIMAVVDTSGSMDQATLRRISGQLKHIEREGEVTVVECDKEIQATYRLRGPVEKVHGRGDTDLRPPLACEFLAKVRPHVIVYFTDGDGPAPQHAPNLPVLWCLTKQGKKPAPWGHVVRMPN